MSCRALGLVCEVACVDIGACGPFVDRSIYERFVGSSRYELRDCDGVRAVPLASSFSLLTSS